MDDSCPTTYPIHIVLAKLSSIARDRGWAGPVELKIRRPSGDPLDVTCVLVVVVQESDRNGWLCGQLTDVTDARRLQRRLMGAERMELVARLAGGLAHDFNNLLTIVTGNTERLLHGLPSDDPLRHAALAVHQAASRASSLTRQLLAFGRRQLLDLKPVMLGRLVADAEMAMTQILDGTATLRIEASPEGHAIRADRAQIEQVLSSLVTNAKDAMPSGGMLTVCVDTIDVGRTGEREREWLRPGRSARLRVADTGVGMDTVAKAYVFQPFFTTKMSEGHRGLGLAMVYGIVKQSRGFVWLDSEAGNGTTVTVLFPVIDGATLEPPTSGDAPRGRRVLLVEPDERWRPMIRDALGRRGYEVLDAASGDEALEQVAASPCPTDLLLYDLRCAETTNGPLGIRARALEPRVQLLVMLDASDAKTSQRALPPAVPTIVKPFTLQALAEKVREVLDSGVGRL